MKAKVLWEFYDSEAKVMRNKRDIIEVTPARFCELVNNGNFLETFAESEQAVDSPDK